MKSEVRKEAGMMRRLVWALLFFVCLGCVGSNQDRLSSQDQERIKQEVTQAFQIILQNSERADLDAALRLYSDTPDFVGIFGDGTMNDYKAFEKANREYFDKVSKQQITMLKDKIIILSEDAAIYAWQGKCLVSLKSGRTMSMNPFAATLVFRRIGNEWKVVYSHESSLPPVEDTGAKK
jgi:ketosteroid isomerase-like protein